MAVKIRMMRIGRRHRPFFRINAIESRNPRNGRILEKLGHYDPIEKDEAKQIVLNRERIEYWLGQGAVPSDSVSQILARNGIETKHADEKTARRAKARSIARAKGKFFNEAERKAAEKAIEAKATAVEDAKKAEEEAKKAAETAKAEEAKKAEEAAAAKEAKKAEEAAAAEAAKAEAEKPAEEPKIEAPAEEAPVAEAPVDAPAEEAPAVETEEVKEAEAPADVPEEKAPDAEAGGEEESSDKS